MNYLRHPFPFFALLALSLMGVNIHSMKRSNSHLDQKYDILPGQQNEHNNFTRSTSLTENSTNPGYQGITATNATRFPLTERSTNFSDSLPSFPAPTFLPPIRPLSNNNGPNFWDTHTNPQPHITTLKANEEINFASGKTSNVMNSPYSYRLSGLNLNDYRPHVREAVYSPDKTTVLTLSHSGEAILWNAGTGFPCFTLPSYYWKVQFYFDGTTIITGSLEGIISLIDVQTGDSLQQLQAHSSPITSIKSNHDGIFTQAQDKSICYIQVTKNKQKLSISSFKTTHAGRDITLWDSLTNHINTRTEKPLTAHTPRGFTQNSDPSINLLTNLFTMANPTSNQNSAITLKTYRSRVNIIHMVESPDKTTVLTLSPEGSANLWDSATGSLKFTLPSRYCKIQFYFDGTTIITGSAAGKISLIDVQTGDSLQELLLHTSPITLIESNSDGIFTTARDKSICHIKITKNNQKLSIISFKTTPPGNNRASHNNSTSLVNNRMQRPLTVHTPMGLTQNINAPSNLLDFPRPPLNQKPAGTLDTYQSDGPMIDILYSPDRKTYLTRTQQGTVYLWDAARMAINSSLSGKYSTAVFNFKGTKIITGSDDGLVSFWDSRITFWDTNTTKLLKQSRVCTSPISSITVGPSQILIKSEDGHSYEITEEADRPSVIDPFFLPPFSLSQGTNTQLQDTKAGNQVGGNNLNESKNNTIIN
ncbi:hypothetical protein H0X06_03750, partial [Candidatus Dependentiae bacterium]|nr:hypothetical protein [Candidatus Dependentiae bacterium]